MTRSTTLVLLGISLVFSIISLAFSAITLYDSPSKTSSNYLLDVNLLNADFNQFFSIHPSRDVNLSTINTLQGSYRYGLWGLCTAPQASTEYTCEPPKKRSQPNILDNVIVNIHGGEYGSGTGNGIYYSTDDVNKGFNGIYAGFVLSVVTTALVLIYIITTIFQIPFVEYGLWPLVFILSIAQWIVLLTGVKFTDRVYSYIYNTIVENQDTWKIEVVKGSKIIHYGWAAMSLGLINWLVLTGTIVLSVLQLSKSNSKDKQTEVEDHDVGESVSEKSLEQS